ncbi:MAG: glycosyltransferase family 1 protein [Planctomycetota bacterium]|nr:MAG: glycosyltransferase family 1 protein [Planctomycetota bacterium]
MTPQGRPRRRIALLFEYPTLHGGERSMLAVLRRLPRTDWDPVALAPPHGPLADALRKLGVAVEPFDLHGRDVPAELPERAARLAEAVMRLSADLVHANSLSMSRLLGAAVDQLNIPATGHIRDIMRLNTTTIQHLNRLDAVAAVSHAVKTAYIEQGVERHRIGVIYNGVDCRVFRPDVPTGVLKEELGLPADTFLIATIGQLSLRKGQRTVADAAKRIVRGIPQAHFLFVGRRHSQKPESVEYEASVWRTFEQAGLQNHLHRIEEIDGVDWLLNEIDLLVHPAEQEPLGRVLLEAGATATPIVATAVGGTPEILVHGESGWLIPPGDPDALADAVVHLWHHPELRDELGEAALRRVRSLFNADRSARAHREFWESMLA